VSTDSGDTGMGHGGAESEPDRPGVLKGTGTLSVGASRLAGTPGVTGTGRVEAGDGYTRGGGRDDSGDWYTHGNSGSSTGSGGGGGGAGSRVTEAYTILPLPWKMRLRILTGRTVTPGRQFVLQSGVWVSAGGTSVSGGGVGPGGQGGTSADGNASGQGGGASGQGGSNFGRVRSYDAEGYGGGGAGHYGTSLPVPPHGTPPPGDVPPPEGGVPLQPRDDGPGEAWLAGPIPPDGDPGLTPPPRETRGYPPRWW
jgi:hypothetical protein